MKKLIALSLALIATTVPAVSGNVVHVSHYTIPCAYTPPGTYSFFSGQTDLRGEIVPEYDEWVEQVVYRSYATGC